MNEKKVKWLYILMYTALVSLINSALSYIPVVPASVSTWISRGIMAMMVVCMFCLSSVDQRYKVAGIMRAGMLACALITAFYLGSVLLTLIAPILSLVAVYQEYYAHAQWIGDRDEKLASRWRSLFVWSILASLLLSFGSTIVAIVLVAMDTLDASQISAISIGLLSIPQAVINIVYMCYLKRMTAILSES